VIKEPESAAGTHHCLSRRAVEFAFERDGDLLLDFFGGQPRCLRYNLGGCVCDVGVRLDRELGPGIVPIDGDKNADPRHYEPLAECEDDEPINHQVALRH
jgi:hypothetical protein